MDEEDEDDEGLEFTESAFRHKISKKDIKHALKTKVLDVPLVRYPQKNAIIGFDRAGNPSRTCTAKPCFLINATCCSTRKSYTLE